MGLPEKMAMEKEGLLLTKDNQLVRMKANMTANSYKIMNFILWKALQAKGSQIISMPAQEIIKNCVIKTNDYSKLLDSETDKIMAAMVEMRPDDKESSEWKKRNLFTDMEYKEGVLTVILNPNTYPLIMGLSDKFTESDLIKVFLCGTYPAMRLYEVCNSWYWTKEKVAAYSVETWRRLLGATRSSYEVFSVFKRYVLEPAIKAVNENTELTISPQYIKEGRRTKTIIFSIRKSKTLGTAPSPVPELPSNSVSEESADDDAPQKRFSLEELDAIKKMRQDFGQTKKNAEKYITLYGVDYCKEQMEYTRQEDAKEKKRNIGGYFSSAIDQDYAGNRQSRERAKEAEQREHEDVVLWNRQAREIEPSLGEEEKDIVQDILSKHREIADLYRGLGSKDRNIAGWIEKYPELLLYQVGVRLQDEVAITDDFIAATLRERAKKKA